VGTGEIRIRYHDRRSALEAYRTGLKHGLLTTPLDQERGIGDPVDVLLELPFADMAVRVKGWVVHTSQVATVVRLEKVPPDIHQIVAEGSASDRLPGWSIADPYPVTSDGSESGHGSGSHDGEETSKRKNYLAARLRQSLEGRASSDGYEAVSAPQRPAPPTPAPPPPEPAAEPTPESMSQGPGIPVPGDPGRFLPGVARFEGALEDTPPHRVLLDLVASRATGVLVVELEEVRYWGFLLGGKPVHYLRHPPLESESTEALLIRKQLLSRPVLDRARWHAEVTGQPLVSIVMRLRLIREKQLHDLREAQIKLVTRRVLDQREGYYRFFETPDLREVFRNPPLDPVPLIWKRAIFLLANRSEAQIQSRVEPLLDQGLHVTSLGRKIARMLPLDEHRKDLVRVLAKGDKSVRQAVKSSNLEGRKAVELVLVLEQLGLARFVKLKLRITADVARSERALKALTGRLHKDHFGLLKLHWSALPDEIRRAFEKFETAVRDLSEPCVDLPGYAKLHDPLQRRLVLLRKLAEDDGFRTQYRAEVVSEGERRMAAEMYLKQGEMALFRRDSEQARECFERLLEVDPGGQGGRERQDRARQVKRALDGGRMPPAAR
jgi:hypothetical protein